MNYNLKHFYSFDTIAPNFIGSRYTNLKLTDILGLESAITVRQDLVSVNQQIKDNVTGASELKAANLQYLKFLDVNNQVLVLAKEWIDDATAIDLTISGGYKRVTISIKGSLDDISIINNALKNLGYYDFEIDAQDYI